jgi:hypothetical protein
VIIKVPHSAWKQYNREELCAEFELSAEELAECAEKGLILKPPPRHKGAPYNELDHLRLRTYNSCIQSGYGLEEVLDLIGRLHRRTAPIRTLILAKAYAAEKLEDLKARMAGGDALELINLRCDADILQAYIDDLTRLQSDEAEDLPGDATATEVVKTTLAKPKPAARKIPAKSPSQKRPSPPPSDGKNASYKPPHQKRPIKRKAPAAPSPPPRSTSKGRKTSKKAYPRAHGSLAEESRRLWRGATPGGHMGWTIPILLIAAIVGGYLYLMPPREGGLFSKRSTSEPPLEKESLPPKPAITDEASSPRPKTSPPTPSTAPKTTPNKGKKPSPNKVSLPEKAASDLEKMMAASGKTAAATLDKPKIIRVNELVVFYDIETRILRAKIELLKNLVADAPTVIGGRIFVVLKPMDDDGASGITTLPRIPLSVNKMPDFSKYGVAFSLEDQKTIYIKTQLSKPPAEKQGLTLYIFDNRENLLMRETAIIQVKRV